MRFLIGLLQLLLPVPQVATGDFLGLSIVNTGAIAASVSVTLVPDSGATGVTTSLVLGPGSQNVALLTEMFRQPVGPGHLRLDSGGANVRAYLTVGGSGKLDGFDAAISPSRNVHIPYVRLNTGFVETAYAETILDVINPGVAPAAVSLILYDTNGAVTGTASVSIAGNRSVQLRTSELFRPNLPPNGSGGVTFEGHLRLQSDVDIAAWSTVDSPLMRSIQRALSDDEIPESRLALASHFVFGGPEYYGSVLNLVNTSDFPITLEATPFDDRGRQLSMPVKLDLRPRAMVSKEVASLFNIATILIFPPPLVSGYIRFRELGDQPFRLAGGVQVIIGSAFAPTAAAFMPLETRASRGFLVPFAANDTTMYTGLVIANPNQLLTVQTDVTIEVLDPSGSVVGTPIILSLSPAQRFAGLVPVSVSAGYVRIRSNLPAMAGALLGSRDGQTLASLPVLR